MHAAEGRWSESRMRENRTSGSMRACRKRALATRLCSTLPEPPIAGNSAAVKVR
jgi:hypothetical protein